MRRRTRSITSTRSIAIPPTTTVRRMHTSTRSTRLVLGVIVVVATALTATASAHRRDEYLQATRVAIAPMRVALQLDLTPGIAVADAIAGEIDRDRDGIVSAEEQRAYVDTVLHALQLDIDHQPIALHLVSSTFPTPDAFTRGEG